MSSERIKVLIVDDIPDMRENLRKLLAFEPDIEVVGGSGAGTGREAVDMAIQLRPDVVLMDINMPDMDGIQATGAINTSVPAAAVVIMSVQSEPGYLRQAMLAGARDYLTKPISSEELYTTIRRVYDGNAAMRRRVSESATMAAAVGVSESASSGGPGLGSVAAAGHIVVIYSPQAGSGVTTLTTNIASALMRQDTRVLLVDCNLQFGDVDAFLNVKAGSDISKLTQAVDDIDQEMVDNVLVTHDSGLKVLVAPPLPEMAYDIAPDAVKEVVHLLSSAYDFVIVDTPTQYDDLTLKLFEIADRVVLVSNPTIPAVRNTRKILDNLDRNNPSLSDKIFFVLNRVTGEKDKGRGTVPTASIEDHLKKEVMATIPLDERAVLTAVNRGVPVVADKNSRTRSPGRELVELADLLRRVVSLEGDEVVDAGDSDEPRSKSGLRALFG